MKLDDEIKRDIQKKLPEKQIVERFFNAGPIAAFHEFPIKQVDIFEEIKNFFRVPYSAIRVAGSARIGFSAHKNREFIAGESDLDIAIVSHECFSRLLTETAMVTSGFRNLSGFGETKGTSDQFFFKEYLAKGMIMTKYMPSCRQRGEIDSFFARLQVKHSDLFKSISAAIYLDDNFYIQKQKSFIRRISDGI